VNGVGELFPRFRDCKHVTIDLETHDPDLKKKGPGVRRDGCVLGVGISIPEIGHKEYYPVRHRAGPCHEPAKVFGWLRDELRDFRGEILGTNINYDADYLAEEGVVAPHAMWRDIQIAEPLLDETRNEYGLEVLAQEYLKEGKRDEAIIQLHGKDWKKKIRDIDSRLVAHYVIGDLDLPERIHALQLKKLEEEGLLELYDMECRLIPMMLYMRRIGVRVDVERAERVSNELYLEALEIRRKIRHLVGFEVNINAGDSIAKAFDKLGLEYGRTATGKPSFTKSFLDHHPHEVAGLIRAERKALKTKSTFVDGYILDGHINGRIHCLFHQLKGDENGTVSGRFSSSLPNLQNIPSRDEILGPLMRAMFIPEEGCLWWARDWSQIEYRILVHYAALTGKAGSAEVVRAYHEDATTDFHKVVAEMVGIPRKPAKDLNFGMVYGQGAEAIARVLGRSLEEAQAILTQYHTRLPFAKLLAKEASNTAQSRGYIKTLLGRRRRFNEWESGRWLSKEDKARICKEKGDPTWFYPIKDKAKAQEKWGMRVKRAYTHAALNGAIQGTAADLMKKAMVGIWEAGICDVLPIHLTVHDELDGSLPDSAVAREALAEAHRIMETVMPLRIPIKAEGTEAANWAEAK
jgi:DNA polymerase I-like protein with 3'-5' exonuclease and polymerase domains